MKTEISYFTCGHNTSVVMHKVRLILIYTDVATEASNLYMYAKVRNYVVCTIYCPNIQVA